MEKASPWRITMPWMGPDGTHERTHVLIPMRARQIWLRGPVACGGRRRGGSHFSCVPHPISAVVVPSSWKPSTLHVFTNSSTALGIAATCVSRSLQWMTFTPRARARRLKLRDATQLLSGFRRGADRLLLRQHGVRDVDQSLLGEMGDQPGVRPVLQTAVGPGSFHRAILSRSLM